MHFSDPDVMPFLMLAGVSAFGAAFVTWSWFGIPPADNVMDWRAGIRRAFSGVDAGLRFSICYAVAAAVALFAASYLRVTDPFWATLVVLMVMRREGIASLELTIHYAVGTLIGVVIAAAVLYPIHEPIILAILATGVAAFARVGFAINPALGFMAFTIFLLFVSHATLMSLGVTAPLATARIYDVAVGCALSLVGTLAATYPRSAGRRRPARGVQLRPASAILATCTMRVLRTVHACQHYPRVGDHSFVPRYGRCRNRHRETHSIENTCQNSRSRFFFSRRYCRPAPSLRRRRRPRRRMRRSKVSGPQHRRRCCYLG